MFNCILTAYVVSTIIIWVVFWVRIHELEKELNTYYYIPSLKDSIIELYVKCDTASVLILFVPIANFIFIIRSILEDHLALIEDIAESIGAVPIETNEEENVQK